MTRRRQYLVKSAAVKHVAAMFGELLSLEHRSCPLVHGEAVGTDDEDAENKGGRAKRRQTGGAGKQNGDRVDRGLKHLHRDEQGDQDTAPRVYGQNVVQPY